MVVHGSAADLSGTLTYVYHNHLVPLSRNTTMPPEGDVEKELLWEAFIAGFKLSGEGFNYEYPMHFDEDRTREEIRHRKRGFEEWYEQMHSEGGTDD